MIHLALDPILDPNAPLDLAPERLLHRLPANYATSWEDLRQCLRDAGSGGGDDVGIAGSALGALTAPHAAPAERLEHEVSVFTEHHVIKHRVVDSALRRAPVRHKPREGLIVARPIEQGAGEDHVGDVAELVGRVVVAPIEEVNPILVLCDQVANRLLEVHLDPVFMEHDQPLLVGLGIDGRDDALDQRAAVLVKGALATSPLPAMDGQVLVALRGRREPHQPDACCVVNSTRASLA